MCLSKLPKRKQRKKLKVVRLPFYNLNNAKNLSNSFTTPAASPPPPHTHPPPLVLKLPVRDIIIINNAFDVLSLGSHWTTSG